MVEEGWIAPVDSTNSRIIELMKQGTMPPADVQQRPSEDDIRLLARFIDNPDYWDVPPTLD